MTNKSPKLFCFRTIILNKGIYPNTTNNIPYCIGLKVIPDNRPCNPPLSSFIKRFQILNKLFYHQKLRDIF